VEQGLVQAMTKPYEYVHTPLPAPSTKHPSHPEQAGTNPSQTPPVQVATWHGSSETHFGTNPHSPSTQAAT
jgi:hypothetical protein